jgi:AcrR family transcriptional regulator
MKIERPLDLRVQKTQEAIQSTFKEMVCEMDASEITVKDLTERARIHRKTFYLHYTCIEALYEDLLKGLAERYFEEIDKIPCDASFKEVNRVFFTFMASQEPYMERMVCTASYHDFCNRLFTTMLRHNRGRYNPYAAFSESEQNIINTFLSTGSLNLYRQWVQDKKALPLDRLIELSGELFTNGIAAALQEKK